MFVNTVVPVLVTCKLENTLILSGPKIYKKLLAESRLLILPVSVESVSVNDPAETDVKSEKDTEEEYVTVRPCATQTRPENEATSTIGLLFSTTTPVALAP